MIFKLNTPLLAAAGIKGMRIQLRIWISLTWFHFSCGGTLDVLTVVVIIFIIAIAVIIVIILVRICKANNDDDIQGISYFILLVGVISWQLLQLPKPFDAIGSMTFSAILMINSHVIWQLVINIFKAAIITMIILTS